MTGFIDTVLAGILLGGIYALFALGLMSIPWMIAVAAAIAAEQLLPWPRATNRLIATGLAVLAAIIVALQLSSKSHRVEPGHQQAGPGGPSPAPPAPAQLGKS